MRPSRTWQAILDGSRNIRLADFERLLQAFGFIFDQQNGSHRIWLHHDARLRMNVQLRSGEAKAYQIHQLAELVEAHRLELRD